MFKISKRSIRRHHRKRLKQKRKQYWGRLWEEEPRPWDQRHLGMCINTPKLCQCVCCCNPRRHLNQETLKEKINYITFKEQEKE